MDFVAIVLGLLFFITLFQAILSLTNKNGKTCKDQLPPGPAPLPIIGCLHLLGDHPHQSLAKLAKTYGSVMSMKLGQVTALVISSSEAAKEVLHKQDVAFSGRHVTDALHAHSQADFSVVWLPPTNQWRTLRKVLNSTVLSNTRLDANQHIRTRKVQELVAFCRKVSGSGDSVDVGRAAFRTSLNIISNTVFSKDLSDPYQDSAKEFKELVRDIVGEAGKPNLVDFFPVLKKIDPQGIRRRMTEHFRKILDLFGEMIDEKMEARKRQVTECVVGNNNDFLDACLKISQENPQEINRNHIETMCLDLFIAGTDTTSSTLEWAMAEVLRNPERMEKAQEELEQVIGKGKVLEESDLSKLPYLKCIVNETLRLHPPAPFLLPRQVETDAKIYQYSVPKGTQVLINTWAIGRDPSLWEDPLEFKPERFLSSEIDVRGRDFELIPFGAGRRMCPGMPLALRTVPLMLGSLLNNFNWKLDGGIAPKELEMGEKFGITLQKANPLKAIPIPLTVP